jgi:hypothetical protein
VYGTAVQSVKVLKGGLASADSGVVLAVGTARATRLRARRAVFLIQI